MQGCHTLWNESLALCLWACDIRLNTDRYLLRQFEDLMLPSTDMAFVQTGVFTLPFTWLTEATQNSWKDSTRCVRFNDIKFPDPWDSRLWETAWTDTSNINGRYEEKCTSDILAFPIKDVWHGELIVAELEHFFCWTYCAAVGGDGPPNCRLDTTDSITVIFFMARAEKMTLNWNSEILGMELLMSTKGPRLLNWEAQPSLNSMILFFGHHGYYRQNHNQWFGWGERHYNRVLNHRK